VIFVDNNSVDDSIKFLEEKYQDLLDIKIVKNDNNLGFAEGNNIGINNAKGEFILLLNNDTWVDSDFLEKILFFYENNTFDLVAPYENDYKNENKKIYNVRIDLLGHPIYGHSSTSDKNFYLSGVCLLFRKELYISTRGLDSGFFMYFEENDWFWRLSLLKKTFIYVPGLYVHHAGAGTTGSGVKYNSFLWRNQNCLQMLLKNYKWFNLLWVLPVYILQNLFEILYFLFVLKPRVAFTYIEGWYFNLKNIKTILKKRKWVQENRLVGDWEIIRKMYIGFAKLHHLINFLKI